MPYWVGVKNGLVVTWLTNTNLYSGCEPNTEAELPPEEDALEPHASSSALTEPTAAPVSAVRRRNERRSNPGARSVESDPNRPSECSERSTASSTRSLSDISSSSLSCGLGTASSGPF